MPKRRRIAQTEGVKYARGPLGSSLDATRESRFSMLPPFEVLWSFGLLVLLLTVTPGVDTALVLRSAAVAGRARAWGAVFGIQLGLLTWGVVSALGVGAVLSTSRVVYDALKMLGAAYLIWIGLSLLRSAQRANKPGTLALQGVDDTFRFGLRQGLFTNLLNPKIGAFYFALLPQFIPPTAPQALWGVSLAGVHVLLGTLWLGALVLVARSARALLRRPTVSRAIDALAGTLIAALGVRLVLDD